jgi:hypothetical protein
MRYDGDERRRYTRSHRGFPAIVDESGPGVLNHVDNISGNGILCHTIKPIPLMTRMGIALELPKPHPQRIECEGIVVRCEPHEVGDDHFRVAIIYTKIREEDRQLVENFVAHDLSQPATKD